jgi:hypothetical protein
MLHPLQTFRCPAHFGRIFPQTAGLVRAQVPRADKRPPDTIQPATIRTGEAAVLSPAAEQLPIRHGKAGQVQKEQVPEIDPHACVPAADIGTGRAGGAAKAVHQREERRHLRQEFMGQTARCVRRAVVAVQNVRETGVGLVPQGRRVPGNHCKRCLHEIVIPIRIRRADHRRPPVRLCRSEPGKHRMSRGKVASFRAIASNFWHIPCGGPRFSYLHLTSRIHSMHRQWQSIRD